MEKSLNFLANKLYMDIAIGIGEACLIDEEVSGKVANVLQATAKAIGLIMPMYGKNVTSISSTGDVETESGFIDIKSFGKEVTRSIITGLKGPNGTLCTDSFYNPEATESSEIE